jgi:phosphatidylglycerophosphate synthase
LLIVMRTDGQVWTREQLQVLRERCFSPPAVAAFLLASQQRANQVRGERPELSRQARQWTALGAAAWLALAVRGSGDVRTRVRPRLLWWAACALMLDWHLGMVETLDGRPCLLGPADALTLARACLVPLAWERPTPLTCAVAGLSDALDGPLARRRGPTRAGRDFDWIADACFAGAALHGAARHRLLERWALRTEATWLSLGVARALHAYFIGLDEPDRSISRPARAVAPARMAGLLAGAAGRRREGSALLGGGALASLAISGSARSRSSPRPQVGRRSCDAEPRAD